MASVQSVRWFVLAVACTSAAAFLLTAPASVRADDTYAAIAFSAKTGETGVGNDNFDSPEKAEKAALAKCKGDDAQVVVSVKNGWCALAVGANRKYGIGSDADRDTACKTAVAECRKVTTYVFEPGVTIAFILSAPSNPGDNTTTSYVEFAPRAGKAPAGADDPEKELARLINAYRADNNLPAVPVSKKLTLVAETHARDCAANPKQGMHDWSQSDKWTGGAFAKDPHIMWDKPKEIAGYPSSGYENAAGSSGGKITAEEALKLWKGDGAHNDVILNKGIWKDMTWKAMGVGIYNGHAHLWFGTDPDPD